MSRPEVRALDRGLTFPIKLRCQSVGDLLSDLGLEAGLTRALGRAFARARAAFPIAEAGLVLQPPYLTDNLLGGAQADALLARIQRAIDTAARAQMHITNERKRRRDRRGSTNHETGVTAREIGEPLEPGRYDRKLGAYVIDSYQGGTEPVKVISFEDEVVVAHSVEVVKIVQGAADEDVIVELAALVPNASAANPLGVIYRAQEGGGAAKWKVVITTGSLDDTVFFQFGAFSEPRYQGPTAKPMFKLVETTPSPGNATAEVVIGGNDFASIKTKYMQLNRERFDEMLKRMPTPHNLTTKVFHQIVEHNFEHMVDEDLTRILATGATQAILVRMSGKGTLIWFDSSANLSWKKAKLTPIIDFKPREKTKTGSGQTGGTADATAHGSPDGTPGGQGLCPPDNRPDDHPPDDCEESDDNLPFLGESDLKDLGDVGETLRQKMQALSDKIGGLNHCDYAGQFCYQAATALLNQAMVTQLINESATGKNAPPRTAKGNMGSLDFEPGGTSSIIPWIRKLADAVHDLSELIDYVADIYEGDYRCSIHGIWRGRGLSWGLRFREAVAPVIKEAVGQMFIGACRSMLLQLLGTSLLEINRRQKAMPRYAVLFERWIVPMIADMAELKNMRSLLQLDQAEKLTGRTAPAVFAASPATAWIAASAALIVALKGNPFAATAGTPYEVVQDQGVAKIRDRKGRLWSNDDLEQTISMEGQIAQGVDPLVKQLMDTEKVRKRFKDAISVREELDSLLAEMVQDNGEMRGKTMSDPSFAFTSSPMEEDIPSATIPGGNYSLQGIHKVAHESIGDAFRNSWYYAKGVDELFDSEEGKNALEGFAVMTGLVLVSVLVPGGAFVAFAAGGALAANAVGAAYERGRLYEALIDPDLVLKHADVEAGIFAAWVGAVIAVIPEAGPATKALLAGGKAAIKGEVKSATKAAGRAVAKRFMEELAECAARDILEAFIKEAAVNIIMDQIIQRALGPVIERVRHEASLGSEGSEPPQTTKQEEAENTEEEEFIQMVRSF